MNPIFEPRPMAPPVRRREKACQSPSSQALGPSPQDERTACRHHYFRWVLGKGAALPWGSPPPSSTQGTAWQEGCWGTLALSAHPQAHAHRLSTLWHLHSQALPGVGASLGCSCSPPPSHCCFLCPLLPGQAMDPHEMVIKNPYTHISIPRAHLRPDLGPGEASRSELPPLPVGSCAPEPICLLRPTDELPGPKGTEGAWQRPAGLGCASQPPVGHGDDIAHHCCCCPCCSCCHCPRFCRCHNRCCCVLS